MNGLVFVFPGQGEQWHGMGAALLEHEPVFAETVRECEAALAPYLDWSVTDVLAGRTPADDIDVIQPALFTLQLGLARLWESRGIVPAAMVGHSLGEVAAACAAGALTLPEAARVITVRSRLYRRLSGTGAMAVVGLTWSEATAVVEEQRGRVALAAANAPGSTVLTGDHDAISALLDQLSWENIFCRRVGTDVAGHSRHVDPLLAELIDELADLRPRPPHVPLWSTVTGRPDTAPDAAYWGRNLREPVLLWPVIRELLEAGHHTIVELSPHPSLLSGLRDAPARLLPSVHRENPGTFAESLAELCAAELSPDGFLADHRVEGGAVVPGAGYLALALEQSAGLRDVRFQAPLALDGPRRLRTRRDGGRITVSAEDRVYARADADEAVPAAAVDPATVRERCANRLDTGELYARFARRGMEYGPAFQGIEEAYAGDGETLVRLRRPAEGTRLGLLDVPLLDAALQAAVPLFGDDGLLLPEGAGSVSLLGDPAAARWAHTRLLPGGPRAALSFDVDLLDDDGRVVLAMRQVRMHRITRGADGDGWRYTPVWVPVGQDAPGSPDARTAPDTQAAPDAPGGAGGAEGPDAPGGAGGAGGAVGPSWVDGLDGVVFRAAPADTPHDALRELLRLARELIARDRPPRLWVVTRGGQAVEPGDTVDASATAVWGMARTLRHEHPELRCVLIDLDGSGQDGTGGPPPQVPDATGGGPGANGANGSTATPAPAPAPAPAENELAVRGGRWYALRLRPRPPVPAGPYRLAQGTPGDLDTQSLRPSPGRPPGRGEVRIRVRAAGLNFNDVLRAIGKLRDPEGQDDGPMRFGLECAGEVVETGEGVTDLAPGSRVAAMVGEIGAMASEVTVDARLAVELPAGLGFEEAAALPAAYVTALYGMDRLARLRRGDRVLVHSAAGGVGQAAVAVARRAGAEVLATAGSAAKRAWLAESGIEHVFDSRSLGFAEEVLAATGGNGVDMVVNSLAGEAIEAGLSTLAPFGHFVELGKSDIAEDRPLRLGPFARSLSFHAVEVLSLAQQRPAVVGGLLREALDAVADGSLCPLPTTVLPAAEADRAFRHMASAAHRGKVVLTFGGGLRADGSYLITGGLSGLGLAAAEQLARDGAGALALLGRGAPTAAAAERIELMRAAGTEVTVHAADVADAEALAAALDRVRAAGPPLRGVLHAAGLLRDRTIAAAEWAEVREVLRPKVDGTRNLHRLTAGDPLDLFVLFSSVAGLLGSGGQAGYAAANAYLDGFAHWRRAQGLPAGTVNWGPWSETGLAARPDRAGRLAQRGMRGIGTAAGQAALSELLDERPAQVAVVPLDLPLWLASNPGQENWSVFADLQRGQSRSSEVDLSSPEEILRALTGWVARVLRIPAGAIGPDVPLSRLGLDSLMAVELRNLVEARAGVQLSTTAFLDSPTVAELTERIVAHRGARPAEAGVHESMAARLDELSDAQVDALLDEILNNPTGGAA